MGIRDWFKKKSVIENKSNYDNRNVNEFDCKLSYHSGINADIKFGNIETIVLDDNTTKQLQSVNVSYNMPDKSFQGKKYYMEPVYDKDGNNITRESYTSLVNTNKPLLKGFFAKEQLDKEPTNYIGYIDYDSNGKPVRGKDYNFERGYKVIQDREMARKQQEREANENKFAAELREQISNVDVNVKTSHAEYLGDKEFVNPHRNNNDYHTR